jgi:bifunctional non-homologous end joining protein LigD
LSVLQFPGAKKGRPRRSTLPLPAFRPFHPARLSDAIPTGNAWMFEMKFDGYRAQALK